MKNKEKIKLLEDTQVVYRKRIEFLGFNIQLLQQDLLASTEYSNDKVNNLDRNINARFDKISKEKEKIEQLEARFSDIAEYNKEKIEQLEARVSDFEVFRDYTIVKQHERSNKMISKKPEVINTPLELDKDGDVDLKDEQINSDASFYYYIDENIRKLFGF